MNIKEAAEYLGISVKTLERKIAGGEIAVAYVPGTTGKQRTFDRSELDRFKEAEAEKAAATTYIARPVTNEADEKQTALAPTRTADAKQMLALVQAAFASSNLPKQDAPVTDLAAKLMLSRDEAARLAGLPATMIRAAIEAKKLKAIKTGAGWRIKRADLEMFVKNL
jgi:excisionase family DNA binding protein